MTCNSTLTAMASAVAVSLGAFQQQVQAADRSYDATGIPTLDANFGSVTSADLQDTLGRINASAEIVCHAIADGEARDIGHRECPRRAPIRHGGRRPAMAMLAAMGAEDVMARPYMASRARRFSSHGG